MKPYLEKALLLVVGGVLGAVCVIGYYRSRSFDLPAEASYIATTYVAINDLSRLNQLHRGDTNSAIEDIEYSLNTQLLNISRFFLHRALADDAGITILHRAAKYKSEYPSSTGDEKDDKAIADLLAQASRLPTRQSAKPTPSQNGVIFKTNERVGPTIDNAL